MVILNERKDRKIRWFSYKIDDKVSIRGIAEKKDKEYKIIVYEPKTLNFINFFTLPRKKVEKKAKLIREK